jgi:M6 family metalloprotease-like protein
MAAVKKLLVILEYYQGQAEPAFDFAAFNQTLATVSAAIAESCYGRLQLSFDVRGWYQLPLAPLNDIMPFSDPYYDEAAKKADPTVNFRDYVGIVLIANVTAGAAFEAPHTYTTNDGTIQLPTSVLPINWANKVHVFVHEAQHGFGVGHSDYLNTASGDAFDNQGNEQNGAVHTNAYFKEAMGWFAPSNIKTVTAKGMYTIEPLETNTLGIKTIKVQRTTGSYFYLEYRQPIGIDTHLDPRAFDGLLIHIPRSDRVGWAWVIDPTPSTADPDTARYDVCLKFGDTFTDSSSGVSMRVDSLEPMLATVTVWYPGDPPPDCPPGYHLDNGVCVKNVIPQCPPGSHIDGDKCVPDVPPSNGSNWLFAAVIAFALWMGAKK